MAFPAWISSAVQTKEAIKQRHMQTCEMIGREELQLRKLLSELSEHRRALILNYRPAEMIRLERELGFDHGKSGNVRENRNVGTK